MVTKVHSNADLTRTISKSIFVTNFPDNTTSADLWKICQTYGVVVDVYIPNRRSKVGKCFAFVRFIKSQPPLPTRLGKIAPTFVSAIKEKPIHQTNVEEESDIKAISKTFFGDQADDLNEVVDSSQQSIPKETSYDPFDIYDILNNENKDVNAAATNSSIPFPLGFTLNKPDTDVGEPVAQKDQFQPDVKSVGSSSHTVESANNVDDQFSTGSIENVQKKKESSSILEILEEMISVGQTMGFSMEGSIKDMERIIDLKGADDVETKAENFSDIEIKSLWGNTNFDAILTYCGECKQCRRSIFYWEYRKHTEKKESGSILEILEEMISETKAENVLDMEIKILWGNTNFDAIVSQYLAVCLDRHLSNHRPILLREFNTDYEATPFRLFYSWFDFQGFDDMITQTWNSISLNDSNAMVRFKKKLQALKKVIRLWIRNYKRNQMNRTTEIKSKLKDIDKLLDQLGANDDLLSSRSELLKQYHDIQSVETRESIQKAKIKWAIEGDENSKFFHGMINRKYANLAVKGVMIEGEWVDDPSKVKDEFRDYFASRFCNPGIRHGVNRLNIDQSGELEAPISRDEIRRAVWDCGENKSPGPDGFTFEFFRRFWNIVGPDLRLVVEWFFHHAYFFVGCNSSFIALIPKTLNPKSVGEYRPISLIGSIYKVVTKILANHLSTVCTVAAKMSAPFVSSLRRDIRAGEESAQLSQISDLLDTVVLSNMGDRRLTISPNVEVLNFIELLLVEGSLVCNGFNYSCFVILDFEP
nr:RNA-directed DNA polymerase, eukaryota [Tanacetum cinerariifolium]